MNFRKTSILLAILLMANIASSQTAFNNTSPSVVEDANTMLATNYSPKKPTTKLTTTPRFHQRLSGTFSGLAIEIIASDLPLERSLPIFRQFGNVHYDKLDKGGYSYIIKTNIDNKKSLEKFYKTVILPRNAQAKMVEYKFGKRNIL